MCMGQGSAKNIFKKFVPHRVASTILITKLLNFSGILYINIKY
jgi:hypothetical protein